MSEGDNDPAFETVLRNTGNIDVFVDAFFSFIARRTDFFIESPPEGGNIGFPPGVAAKLIISKYKKWQEICAASPSFSTSAGSQSHVPEAICDIEVPSSSEQSQDTSHQPSSTVKNSPSSSSLKKTTSDMQYSSASDSYNGRKTDKYSWSQSMTELDVHVMVDKKVKTKHDVQVEIQPNRLRILVPSAPQPVLVDWRLPNVIVKDESIWSLHPGEAVFISLQKARERWWVNLFEGEEPLDRTKIESVRPMEELGEEEQAKIQELVFNQEQKLKGLPTSEESNLQKIMKKAWDAEGSPFKGQPYDPSRVQLSNNSLN